MLPNLSDRKLVNSVSTEELQNIHENSFGFCMNFFNTDIVLEFKKDETVVYYENEKVYSGDSDELYAFLTILGYLNKTNHFSETMVMSELRFAFSMLHTMDEYVNMLYKRGILYCSNELVKR